MRLVKIIILTLLVIVVGGFFAFGLLADTLGGFGFSSVNTLFILIFSGIFALLIGIIADIHYRKMQQTTRKRWGTFFSPNNILLIMVVGVLSPILIIYGYSRGYSLIMNIKYEMELKEQSYESIKIGTIRKDNSDLTYECLKCSYRIKFPNTWAFRETTDEYSTYLYLATPDVKRSGVKVLKGASFSLKRIQADNVEFQKNRQIGLLNNPSVEKISKGNITALVEKTIGRLGPDDRYAYVWIYANSHIFEIYVVYGNEYEFNQFLEILLNDFEEL